MTSFASLVERLMQLPVSTTLQDFPPNFRNFHAPLHKECITSVTFRRGSIILSRLIQASLTSLNCSSLAQFSCLSLALPCPRSEQATIPTPSLQKMARTQLT